MLKLLLISLLLLVLGGCVPQTYTLNFQNYSELFINDSNLSLNFTYSSFKINELINNISVNGSF